MSLTQEQVKHIANLSRLELSQDDVITYSKDLNSIVDYIDVLNEIPNSNLDIEADILGMTLRCDEITSGSVTREELLACSPKQKVNHSIAIGNIMN